MSKLCRFLQVVIIALLTASEGFGKEVSKSSVHVINGLPENSEAMKVECRYKDKITQKHKSLGVQELSVGDDYSWVVEEIALYFCEAIWRTQMGSWHAFQPQRDGNRDTIFWLLKDNGFFLSWDNSTWLRRSTWESE